MNENSRSTDEITPPKNETVSKTPKKKSASLAKNKIAGKGLPVPTALSEEIVRLGKDEMNLVEHPFAILWQKEPGDSAIFNEWTQVHPVSGKALKATWMVTGAKEYGLPTASDERVYLVLMELTREKAFKERTVWFSRYDIVRRLGWTVNDRSYAMLENALKRLTGAMIYAKNAFWNPTRKTYMNAGFHLLEHFVIDSELPGRIGQGGKERISYFTWSEFVFESFQNGYIRSIDLRFALSLEGDIALRLYRYLDKKSYDGRSKFEIDIFTLCVAHLGMKPSAYPSKLKERLEKAHTELTARGFLKSVEFVKTRSGDQKSEKLIYHFTKRRAAPLAPELPAPAEEAPDPIQGTLRFDGPETREDEAPAPAPPEKPRKAEEKPTEESLSSEALALLAEMEALRVSRKTALELLEQWPLTAIRSQLDCLEDRKPKSRPATFVKSVREVWALPDEFVARREAVEREKERVRHLEAQERQKREERALEAQETARLEEESAILDAMWEKLDENHRNRMDAEITQKLGPMGQSGLGNTARKAFRREALREMLALFPNPQNERENDVQNEPESGMKSSDQAL